MGKPYAAKFTDFGGMIPRRSETLLPDSAAHKAANCRLLSGAIEGLRQLMPIENLLKSPRYSDTTPPTIAYPVGSDPEDFVWYPFANRDVMMVRGPIINDAYNRYYWTGQGEPKYNTEERMRNGDPPLLLGVPGPVNAPTVTPAGGDPQAARVYTYTFISPYGEEGPPAPPTVATGGEGTWTIEDFGPDIPRWDERAPGTWKLRIYRTVSGTDTTLYYYVDEIDIPDPGDLSALVYTDNIASDAVVLNSVLESEDWEPPPADLDYLIVHPNGFMLGFAGNDVFMSVPFRPHAWPQENVVATEYPIVAMGVFGQSVAVATRANPYILSGVTPLAMTFVKTNDSTPCLSRYGLVSFDNGVLYPSERGLMLVNGTDAVNATEMLITGNQWKRQYLPEDILASVRYDDQYIAFYAEDEGFIFTPNEEAAAWSLLTQFSEVDSLILNGLTGKVYVMRSGIIYEWDSPILPPVQYCWRTKVMDFKYYINLGAMRLTVEKPLDQGDDPELIQELVDDFNAQRFAYPLAPIGAKMFGAVRVYEDIVSAVPQNRDPGAGSALRPQGLRLGQDLVRVLVWADEELVLDTFARGEDLIMLPDGFKALRWQFEVRGYQRILNFSVGTSPAALKEV